MELINTTRSVAGYSIAPDKTGREWLVVVAKGTYGIPEDPDQEPRLLDQQVPLVMTDVFTGEPGFSAPLYELDFAPFKPRCDVLLNGRCHAPDGRPARTVGVGLKVGPLRKLFNVVGPRVFKGVVSSEPDEPRPFTIMPITYDNAYGGVDRTMDPAQQQWYLENHAGVGYYPKRAATEVAGKLLPNTEELENPVLRPDGRYKPMAFGPIGRAWQQRVRWAGTYDQKWQDEQCPFLPEDFDERYFQCAPEDQQSDYPRGGEEVVLLNLTPEGRTAFRLPASLGLDVLFVFKSGDDKDAPAAVDTVIIEPDRRRFMLVWRARVSLKRNIFDVRQGVVGVTARRWKKLQAREEGTRPKKRFSSLAELAAWERSRQARTDE